MRPASAIGKSIQKPRPAALPGNAGAGVSLGSPRRSSIAHLLAPHFTHRTDVEYRDFTLREQTAWAWSEGGAYVHNLFAGEISTHSDDDRMTPFHRAHSTAIAGLQKFPSADDRYYHNVLVQRGDLSPYDTAKLPVKMGGNVFLKGAKPSRNETGPLLKPEFDPALRLVEKTGGFYLEMTFDKAWRDEPRRALVTTKSLGNAVIPNQPYEQPDGTPLRLATDYAGNKRSEINPFPGPFELSGDGRQMLKVWPHSGPLTSTKEKQ